MPDSAFKIRIKGIKLTKWMYTFSMGTLPILSEVISVITLLQK